MKSQDYVSDDHYLVSYEVDSGHDGARLDSFLKEQYRKRSREQLKRAIAEGAVIIRREQGTHLTLGKLKPSTQLLHGDEVQVISEKKPEPEVCFDYRVIHEDEAVLVVDKPANLPVHPAGRYFFNTLLIHLRTQGHRDPLKAGTEYFLAHRIDKETSGILLLAKEREACADIVRQFADRTTQKRYLAVVHGVPEAEFTVDLPMRRSTRSIIDVKMMIAPEDEGGQSAQTFVRRLSTHRNAHGEFSVVECFPKTGRQHQIRLHLEAMGHPIVGDKLYGLPENEAVRFYERRHLSAEAQAKIILPRHALHAASLAFTHPLTRQKMEFHSELPEDLRGFIGKGSNASPEAFPVRSLAAQPEFRT